MLDRCAIANTNYQFHPEQKFRNHWQTNYLKQILHEYSNCLSHLWTPTHLASIAFIVQFLAPIKRCFLQSRKFSLYLSLEDGTSFAIDRTHQTLMAPIIIWHSIVTIKCRSYYIFKTRNPNKTNVLYTYYDLPTSII